MNKISLFTALVIFLSCMGKKNEFKTPPGYDLSKPEKFSVPEALDEISGICFYKGKNDTVYAEQDEEGKVYFLRLGDKKAHHVKFGKGGDYEDIAIINDLVVLLRSDGTLFSFPFQEIQRDEVTDVKEWTGLLPAGEYEGMCVGAKDNQLYILCKHCKDDETTKAITAYMLDLQPGGEIKANGSATVDVTMIEKIVHEEKFKFHPSALGRNPVTGDLYIVSSVNKLLVIADANWNVKNVYPLDPTVFRQPEGIAFDNKNNLYISNEGDELTKGNVLKFAFKKNH